MMIWSYEIFCFLIDCCWVRILSTGIQMTMLSRLVSQMCDAETLFCFPIFSFTKSINFFGIFPKYIKRLILWKIFFFYINLKIGKSLLWKLGFLGKSQKIGNRKKRRKLQVAIKWGWPACFMHNLSYMSLFEVPSVALES